MNVFLKLIEKSSSKSHPMLTAQRSKRGGGQVQGAARDVTYLCPFIVPVRGSVKLLTVRNYKIPTFIVQIPDSFLMFPLGVFIEKMGRASSFGENSNVIQLIYKDLRKFMFCPQTGKSFTPKCIRKTATARVLLSFSHGMGLFAFEFKKKNILKMVGQCTNQLPNWNVKDCTRIARELANHQTQRKLRYPAPAVWVIPATAATDEVNSDMWPLFVAAVVYQ